MSALHPAGQGSADDENNDKGTPGFPGFAGLTPAARSAPSGDTEWRRGVSARCKPGLEALDAGRKWTPPADLEAIECSADAILLDKLVDAGRLGVEDPKPGEMRQQYRVRMGVYGTWAEQVADQNGYFSDDATRRAENRKMRNHIVAGTAFARRRGDEPCRAWREQAHTLARKHVALARDVRAQRRPVRVCGARPSRPAVRRQRRVVTRSSAASGDSGDGLGQPPRQLVDPLNLFGAVVAPEWLPGHGDIETHPAPVGPQLACDDWIGGTF